ncbi:MAG: hypothetical protein ACW99A_13625 [Candidatus Kariarchaeaceae archaeon]|jgi:DNA-directed RNA polymerase subunit M/transcription elongation factor TFIIS
MFCPECDSVLILKKTNNKKNSKEPPFIGCADCNYKVNNDDINVNFVIKEVVPHDIDAWIEVIEARPEKVISPEIREELRELYREEISETG